MPRIWIASTSTACADFHLHQSFLSDCGLHFHGAPQKSCACTRKADEGSSTGSVTCKKHCIKQSALLYSILQGKWYFKCTGS